MTVTVEPFAERFVGAVAALEAACFSQPWSEAALREELGNPCARFLVATDGGQVVGYLGCHHIAGEGFIANVATHPDYRRRGVARALLEAARTQGAAQRLERLTLEVRASNAPAIALYEQFGFTKDGVRRGFYSHPAEDAVIYSYYYTEAKDV